MGTGERSWGRTRPPQSHRRSHGDPVPSLPSRSAAAQGPRGQGRAQRCLQSPENSGNQPGAITVLIPGGQQRIALSPAFTARAAVTNPVSLSRNNSGPFQQEPLGNPGARGLCKRVWNMLEPNASSGQRDGASRATTAAPGGDFIFPQDSNSQEFEHSSAYR